MSGEKRCPECGRPHIKINKIMISPQTWMLKEQVKSTMKREEASIILEDVIDTLKDGITYEDLHEAADKLLIFRDQWFKILI